MDFDPQPFGLIIHIQQELIDCYGEEGMQQLNRAHQGTQHADIKVGWAIVAAIIALHVQRRGR